MGKQSESARFVAEATRVLNLRVAHRVNRLGGYGPESEVIYEGHPFGCPSVLVDSRNGATATFMSNGSVGFSVKLPDGMDVRVLEGHFDPVEKRECGAPSGNVWLQLQRGQQRWTASLINPNSHIACPAGKIRVVKLGDPRRAMWYCAWFHPEPGIRVATAVKLSLRSTSKGPVLLREILVRNMGRKPVGGTLWTQYFLHGTQRFVYNKQIWYDAGCPVSLADTVMTARVPYSDIVQIKRLHNEPENLRPVNATCDYATFHGDTAAYAIMPAAVRQGAMLRGGAGRGINRFSTAAIAANQFGLKLNKGGEATLRQSLLYVTDQATCETFRQLSGYREPNYHAMAVAFKKACRVLLRQTDVRAGIGASTTAGDKPWPYFEVQFPAERTVSEYANSVWTGVKELYENCRAHGARLADGIELGTRDRGQDMWPMIKEAPARVRADLIHALSFMYVTHTGAFPKRRPLTLREKLHGMFPRQYPSQWNNRNQEVRNDNRPYSDSPLWLIDALLMYVRETGDLSVLVEEVKTVSLTAPDTPETSGIVGCNTTLAIAEVALEVFACFARHAEDSPYGIAQILYGDWCDPVDMFGTSEVGNAGTRGRGRGGQARLSAHVFLTLVGAIDTLASRRVADTLAQHGIAVDIARLQAFANRLRRNIVKVAWEDTGARGFPAGFLSCIHELTVNGGTPDYARGETGYTLGSMLGRDFDNINRRDLLVQAHAVEMLLTKRPYLTAIPGADGIVAKVLRTVDRLFYDDKLGLVMFTKPISNNQESIAKCGRMGVLPPGTAENGEYHHGQVMMHRYRLSAPGSADTVWKQFKPMMSALRDDSIAGPFESPTTSYVSDKDDPHFGKGMYFGLSGSVGWIVEVFHKIVGITLALHDPAQPALRVEPNLPAALDHTLTFRRVVHAATGPGVFRRIPLQIDIKREGRGQKLLETIVMVNGERKDKAEIASMDGLDRIAIAITHRFLKTIALLVALAVSGDVGLASQPASPPADAYETYVKTSKDFKAVKQDKAFLTKMYPSWTFMPWYYQWSIGHDDAAGAFCQSHGINGAFTDRGATSCLDWIDKYQLRFYMDHTAGKGDLHQWDGGAMKPHLNEIHGAGVRVRPVNAAMRTKLEGVIRQNIERVKSSPMRAAYALDDEISWGHFIHPCMWQVTDDAAAYPAWLKEVYGPQAPARTGWIGYNDIMPKLSQWSVSTFDASPLMDQWTFNDSYWNNFIGDLVSYANSVDPAVPCGYVGGQCPNAFGGYDYAKLMRKIQYLEAYNMANAQSLIRSFNPHNAMPTVTTFFYAGTNDAVWQAWYYLAQGNRGHIAWVEKWFNDDKTPKAWLQAVAPTYLECGRKIGPLMNGAEFKSDGVALYYSHASIQLGWILDAAAHGKTWVNRNNDDKLGSAHLVRNAWCNMLRDEGIQFTWLSYVDLIQNGVPAGIKALILPATLCLSDAEARQIKAFCQAGGTVIADYLPGVWDQHGKGRPAGGALDDLFGVKHDSKMTAKDVFPGTGKLWCEVDQDRHFSYTCYAGLLGDNSCLKDASGFNKAVRAMDVAKVNKDGKGTAVLMNLSPQWYNAYRAAGPAEAAKRAIFMKPIHDAGIQRWAQIKGAGDKEFGYEITAWTKGDRTVLFLFANKEIGVSSEGGGAAAGLKSGTLPVTLAFARDVSNAKDERSGKRLGNGRQFAFDWIMNEAVVLSFEGPPPW